MYHCHVERVPLVLFSHLWTYGRDYPPKVCEEELLLVFEVGEAVVVEEGFTH